MNERKRIFLSSSCPISTSDQCIVCPCCAFSEPHNSYQTWWSNKGNKHSHFLNLLLSHCLEFHKVVTSSLKILNAFCCSDICITRNIPSKEENQNVAAGLVCRPSFLGVRAAILPSSWPSLGYRLKSKPGQTNMTWSQNKRQKCKRKGLGEEWQHVKPKVLPLMWGQKGVKN